MVELRQSLDDREATIEQLQRDLAGTHRQADTRWHAPNGVDATPSTRRQLDALQSELAALRRRNLLLEGRLAASTPSPDPIP